jgi:flagellar biosynthetic protein FliR
VVVVTSAQIDAWLGAFVWPFLRILAFFAAAPLVRDASIPTRVKVGLAVCIAIVVAPTLPENAVAIDSARAPLVAVHQVLIGVALAWVLRVVFAAVELAGELVGLQMGLAFGGFIDPQSGGQAQIVGSFLGLLAMLVFLAMDGHLTMIAALARSFDLLPVGADPGTMLDAGHLAALGGELFALGLQLAAAPAATVLLVNVSLGVLARSAPQLNVFAVGFPATLLVGFFALAASLGGFLAAVQAALDSALAGMLR